MFRRYKICLLFGFQRAFFMVRFTVGIPFNTALNLRVVKKIRE